MSSRWNRPVRTFVLPVLAAAAIGWVLARSIHSLTRYGSPPRLLLALVYGPLLELGDVARPPLAGAYFAALLAVVLIAGRDRRWLYLAMVAVGIGLLGAAATIDIRWLGSWNLPLESLARAFGFDDVHRFTRDSPEGFLFITLGASAWHVLIVGYLVAVWARREPAPADVLTAPPRLFGFLVAAVRDVAPVPLAWAAFGYAAGACIDGAAGIGFGTPPAGGVTTSRLFVGPPASYLEPVRGSLAMYFGGLAFLLWHACGGPRARWRAGVCYAVAVLAQLAVAASSVTGAGGFQNLFSPEAAALRRMLEVIPGRLAFLAAGGVAWHVFAVWCLFRYRSDRAGG